MVRCVPCRIADKKRSSRPAYRDERKLPRYHPNSARVRRTLCAVTGGPAGDWPELTGEQSTFLAGRSQPAASLSGAEPWYYFPDPSNKLNNKAIYTTLCATNQCKRGRKFDAARQKRYNNRRKSPLFRPGGRSCTALHPARRICRGARPIPINMTTAACSSSAAASAIPARRRCAPARLCAAAPDWCPSACRRRSMPSPP